MAKARVEDQIVTAVTEVMRAAGLDDPGVHVMMEGNGHFFTETITISFIKPYGHHVVALHEMSDKELLDKLTYTAGKADKQDNDITLMRQLKHELTKRLKRG